MTPAPGGASASPVFFPIRHHSPACALALLRALEEIAPTQVLVEAPVDFEPLLPLLTDPATLPPVAIVSLPDAKDCGEDGYVATYPFCAHSPEMVALTWAKQHGARAVLIDLPARHPQMRRDRADDGPTATPLISDWRLDHNAYVSELCTRRGVADGYALWDALFESQADASDWRGFFDSVGLYCRHTREVADPAELAADGTLAREAHMRACLSEAKARADGPIAVITGGFHTPALRDPDPADARARVSAPAPNAYLVRYGFRQLDAYSGYGAGLPHPGWYDRVWRGGAAGLATASDDLLAEFAAHLRATRPQLALSTPSLASAVLAARRLAALRDLPAAGRSEIIDAVRSTGVKEALDLGRAPLLDLLHAFLTGDALGDLPSHAAQPPIVESVRDRARSLGFNLEDGARRTRDLDLLRKPRHAEASRFLFALDLVGAGFADRIAGPDLQAGWRTEALIETWGYAWSPMVEARLIGRAADGQTLESLCLAELERRHASLVEAGRSRSASAAAELLVVAVRIGIPAAVARAAEWCVGAVAEDADPASIIGALSIAVGLSRAGPGAHDLEALFADLKAAAFERLPLIFPDIVATSAERLPDTLRGLAQLAALASEGDDTIARARLGEATRAALAGSPEAGPPPPALDGALTAFAGLIGALSEWEAAARIAAMFSGAYVDGGDVAAALTGALTVSPRLIVHSRPVLEAVDGFFETVDGDAFLAALPELRMAFSQLTPGEVDRVAAWAGERHGVTTGALLDDALSHEELTANLALSARLEAIWRDEGLAAWVEDAP
jgi:hypothetical protein